MTLTHVQRKHQPKYVLRELDRLEREVAYWRGKVEAIGAGKGDIIVSPYSNAPVIFDGDESVQFNVSPLPNRRSPNNIQVRRITDHRGITGLSVMAAEDLAIEPQSGNVAKLFSERRR